MNRVVIVSHVSENPRAQDAFALWLDDTIPIESESHVLSPGKSNVEKLAIWWANSRHARASVWVPTGKEKYDEKKVLRELAIGADAVYLLVGDRFTNEDQATLSVFSGRKIPVHTIQIPHLEPGEKDPPPVLPGQTDLF